MIGWQTGWFVNWLMQSAHQSAIRKPNVPIRQCIRMVTVTVIASRSDSLVDTLGLTLRDFTYFEIRAPHIAFAGNVPILPF